MALSERALGFAQDIRFSGPLEGATHCGVEGDPGGGPHMEICLKVVDGHIRDAAYRTHGCPSSRACGAALCRLLATGMTVESAMKITDQDLTIVVGGLPEGKGHFAGMAILALHAALLGGQS